MSSSLNIARRWDAARWAPIPLRLIVGYGFMAHGYAKLMKDPDVFVGILHAIGVPAPHVMAWLTILVELLGGLAILLGAFVPLVSLPMAAVLLMAIFTVHLPYGFTSIKLMAVTAAGPPFVPPRYETDLLYLACLAALVAGGSGPFSVAQQSLERIGVKVLLNRMVQNVDAEGVIIADERTYSKSVLWAAGVVASPAAKWLKAESDGAGRVKVESDLSVPNLRNVFVIGDAAASDAWHGRPVPGLAPAAKQGGIYIAKLITAGLLGISEPVPFAYHHLGSLATIGRKSAVADFGWIRLGGAFAWWLWGLAHLVFLVGGRNRSAVVLNWAWSYFSFRASTRLITGAVDDPLAAQ